MEFEGRPRDNGLYAISAPAIDGQKFWYGKRILTFDGKVFKYGHAKTALISGFLAANAFTVNNHIKYAVLPTAIVSGAEYCYVTCPASAGYSSVGFTQDELIGGYIVVGHNASHVENRTITGNDSCGASSAAIRIWVDGKFGMAHAITDGVEAYPNPYAYLSQGNNDFSGFMGVPSLNTTIAYDCWIQTWGPCWVTPGGSSSSVWGEAAGDRSAFAVGDGSVNDYTTLTTGSYGRQRVGFTIDTTSSAVTGMPLIMLQISV